MTHSVNIWLMGGLGNVLFQVNYGRFLRAQGLEVNFIDNLVRDNIFTRLLGWTIHAPDYRKLDEKFHTFGFLYAGLAILSAKMNVCQFSSFTSDTFAFPANLSKNVFCYFQSQTNLREAGIRINRGELVPSNSKVSSQNDLVIHRRYTDTGWPQPDLTPIIPIIKTHKIIVCSESKEDACKELSQYDLDYENSTALSSFGDFIKLIDCKVLVCSNSTFCLWAALLGDHQSVYMPKLLIDSFPVVRDLQKSVMEF
jgi:hypothetical protein